MCVDYRALNSITVKQPIIMPACDELLAKVAGFNFFTTLDLMSGYYQIPVHAESRKFTAFVTQDGHYEFARMPFGLKNAPAVFQTCMNEMVKTLPPGEVIVYLNDTIIPSTTVEQGLERLRRFLQALEKVGMTLRCDKCVFLQERIKFLGHNIIRNQLQPGDTKTNAIRKYEPPTDVSGERRFLGLTNYFQIIRRLCGR